MNTSFFQSQPLASHVTPSKNDIGLTGHDFSFLDDIDSPSKSCNPMDADVANPMDADDLTWSRKGFRHEDDDKMSLERQLCETRRQLEEMKTERDQGREMNHHLVQELGQMRTNLHQERVMHESTVQHVLQQQSAVNERAVQTILSCILPQHITMFPQGVMIGRDGNLRNYMIGATMGKGSFGRVVRATHVATKTKFAIKLVPVDSQGLKQEITALMRCNHPNIVLMQEYIIDQGQETLGIVMELGHMNLHTYMDSGNVLDLSALREITLATLKAVEYLHSQGICHMDIKSDNLLLMKKKNVATIRQEDIKLCDFGLCTIASEGQQHVVTDTMLKGTPRFFAPEMANFVPYNAKAADIWSIGCTLLDLTEEMSQEWHDSYDLFDDADDINRDAFKTGLRRILRLMSDEDYFDHNPNLSPAFDLMRRLLKFKPSQRITATQALQHEWLQENNY